MTPLASLLAAVDAGTLWADDALVIPKDVSKLMSACFTDDQCADFAAAYDGSVNDAILLVEAMLPGCVWSVRKSSNPLIGFCAGVYAKNGTRSITVDIDADTPARALLTATLRAIVDREGA